LGNKIVKNKWIEYEDYVELNIENPTHGIFNLKIDLEDYEKCRQYHWNIQHAGGEYSYKYYAYSDIKGKRILLHRFIMNVSDRKQAVDHINKDGLTNEFDNRKYNLRICTIRQNSCNVDKQKNNTSGYKGVIWYYYNNVNKWYAYVKQDYKTIGLGYYDKLEDAVKARNDGEIKYYGEFARIQEFKG